MMILMEIIIRISYNKYREIYYEDFRNHMHCADFNPDGCGA